tara:strand:- start:339 stop:1055 length:717 start_codon:yes stop_codon:yes gene_type:complete
MAESKNPKFDRAFAAARKKFKKTGDANDYTFYFKGEGREGRFTVNQKGETKKGLMAKFAPGSKNTGANYKVKGKDKVRPKLRPKSTEPGELTPGQIAAQELVYKKFGGKPQDIKSGIKRKMAKFNTDGTVADSAQKARPGARPKPTLKEKPETVEQKRKKIDAKVTARQEVTRRQQTQTNLPASLPPSVKKLKAFKAGTLKLDQRTAFRLIKSLKDYNEKNPKNKVIIPKKLIDLGRM